MGCFPFSRELGNPAALELGQLSLILPASLPCSSWHAQEKRLPGAILQQGVHPAGQADVITEER